MWIADTCAELADLCDRHARGDGTFEPVRVAQLAGEALMRSDALAAPASVVPRLLAAGPRSTAETTVGGARLVGIGTRVRDVGHTVDVDALVYDTSAYRLLAIGRTFEDAEEYRHARTASSQQRRCNAGSRSPGRAADSSS